MATADEEPGKEQVVDRPPFCNVSVALLGYRCEVIAELDDTTAEFEALRTCAD